MKHAPVLRAVCALAALAALAVVGPVGCDSEAKDDPPPPDTDAGVRGCEAVTPASAPAGTFAAPQAVLFAGEHLLVANTAGTYDAEAGKMVWGQGTVLVLDPMTGEIKNRLVTTQPNPTRLATYGDSLYILNTGPTQCGADGCAATGPGSIDYLPLAQVESATGPNGMTPLPFSEDDPRIGGFLDMAFAGHRAYLGSGLSNTVFVFNAASGVLERGADNPVVLGAEVGLGMINLTASADGTRLYAANFNTDEVFVIDAQNDTPLPCAVPMGADPASAEGAGSPRVLDDHLYVLLPNAGTIAHRALAEVDTWAAGPDCGGAPAAATLGALGQIPNLMEVIDGDLYVVQSGDNNVVALAADGAEAGKWSLAEGAGAWAVAASGDGRYLAVTELMANGVTLFDRVCEGRTWRVGLAP